MLADPIQSVLFDFENLIWLTVVIGLIIAAGWRRIMARRSPGIATASGDSGVLEGRVEPVTGRWGMASGGVPVSHFNAFDLALLPLVLMKYSFSLQWILVSLASSKSPAESGEAAADTVEKGTAAGLSPSLLIFDMSINLLLIALIILMIQWVGNRDLDSVLGLSRYRSLGSPQRFLWPALFILGGAAICTPIILISSNSMPSFLEGILGEEVEEQAAVQTMRAAPDWSMRILLILNACLVAPVVEELVFRGYFYGVMKRYTGAMFAAFVSAAIFSVAHQSLLALLPLWGFALLLTLFYESTRCLWVPIGIHALFNAINVSLILTGVGGEG